VREKGPKDQPWIEALLNARWGGGGKVIVHGEVFDAGSLSGLIAAERMGLATFQIRRAISRLNQSLAHKPLHRLCDAFFVVRSRNPLGHGLDGLRCITHGNTEADFLQHFQIVQSVADGCRMR
jgi:hypothetical protein